MERCRDERGQPLRPDGGECERSGTLAVKIRVELSKRLLCANRLSSKGRSKVDSTIKISGPDSDRFWWRVHDGTKASSDPVVEKAGWKMLAGYKTGEFWIARQ